MNYSCKQTCVGVNLNKRHKTVSINLNGFNTNDNIKNLRFIDNNRCVFISNNKLFEFNLDNKSINSIVDSELMYKIDFIGIANQKLNRKHFLNVNDIVDQKQKLSESQYDLLFNSNKLINYWIDDSDIYLFFKINTPYIENNVLMAASTNFITKINKDSILFTIPLIDKYNNIKNDGIMVDNNLIYLSNSIILFKDSLINKNYNPSLCLLLDTRAQSFKNVPVYYPIVEKNNVVKYFESNPTLPYYKFIHTTNFASYGNHIITTDYKCLLTINGDSTFRNMTKENEIIATIPFEINPSDNNFLYIKSVINQTSGDIQQLLSCYNVCNEKIIWEVDITNTDKVSNYSIYKNSFNYICFDNNSQKFKLIRYFYE